MKSENESENGSRAGSRMKRMRKDQEIKLSKRESLQLG